ncbi:MAG: T9SS type A sorting domain-containing protein [Ignavibacteriales bacterium]|nr:T9SS type A sorting domain-containing protein [Ignavibacteriales bacterium]
MKSLPTIFLLSLIPSLAFAQSEFIVNTTLDSVQRDPQIARDAGGNYVVVWKSEGQVDSASRGDIYLQFFDADDSPASGETLVNTVTGGDQDKPAISMNANGDLVIVWASYTGFSTIYDIKARLFKNRTPLGDEFLANTTTIHTQTNPAVAIGDSGSFIVVWDSWFQDGSDKGVYGQRFDAAGQKVGSEFQVNVTTAHSQARPAISFFPDGRFVVIWESWKQDIVTPSGYGLFGRIFNADGTPAGGEFHINTYTNDYQWFGDIETIHDDRFVVVWCSWEQDGDDGGIYLQFFDGSGNKMGPESLVNKTTVQYQWLPKVRKLPGGNLAVAWSSWKQDGSREGVFGRILDSTGRNLSFEIQLNEYTESFQWEPDLIATGANEILAVWSSWGQTGNNYDVIGRRIAPPIPAGYLAAAASSHTGGRTTSRFVVHVIDSASLTGQTYELRFRADGITDTSLSIVNLTILDTVISEFKLNRGAGIFYVTPVFDGVAVEVIPEFHLSLDTERSHFINQSGTNLIFQVGPPTAGVARLAPIDAALIWGSLDTLTDGRYAAPLDTALGITGVRNVIVPFRAWNLMDNERMDLLVVETGGIVNQRFDPGERIVFLTPTSYRIQTNNTHAQIATSLPGAPLLRPASGDTNIVLTRRPMTSEDRFVFTTSPSFFVDVPTVGTRSQIGFALLQNYPNPFNPTTTISLSIPAAGNVRLIVYDILGRHVATLVDGWVDAGQHRVLFQAAGLSSGVYFSSMESAGLRIVRKMLLVR